MNEFKTLNIHVENHSQTVRYLELLQLDQHKLRLTVNANTYRDQSFAVIERWSGSEWKLIYGLNGGSMATEVEAMYCREEFSRARLREDQSTNIRHQFRIDRATLMARAAEVLALR